MLLIIKPAVIGKIHFGGKLEQPLTPLTPNPKM